MVPEIMEVFEMMSDNREKLETLAIFWPCGGHNFNINEKLIDIVS